MLKLPLSPAQLQQLGEHSKAGREHWKNGCLQAAEACFLAAWDVIPQPQYSHDHAQSLSRGMVEFFKSTGQYEKAKHWLGIMRRAYETTPCAASADYVDFIAATVYLDAGDTGSAYEIFNRQYNAHGKRPFMGEDRKYLAFYLKHRSSIENGTLPVPTRHR